MPKTIAKNSTKTDKAKLPYMLAILVEKALFFNVLCHLDRHRLLNGTWGVSGIQHKVLRGLAVCVE